MGAEPTTTVTTNSNELATHAATPATTTTPPPPQRRVVLLGASNLMRGISTAIESAHLACGPAAPLDVLAAFGAGRSYGTTSNVLGRRLPGILQSGLWQALRARPPLPTTALVTDIGNDLAYGVPVPQITAWIDDCLQRLASVGATRPVLTLLPEQSLRRLPPWRFRLVRTLLFPRNRMSLAEVLERAAQLNDRLRLLAAERALPMVDPDAAWFGLDPIHIRRRAWSPAWRTFVGPWAAEAGMEPPPPARGSAWRWIRLQLAAPECRSWFGFARRHAQPCLRLPDGTTLSFF